MVEDSVGKFDLNIEKILEDWEVHHAIREVIANAIDEQILTRSKPIEIRKDKGGTYHVRDYGRGINHIHLTQKENDEKKRNPKMIGKFGIGLKDALATFDRKGVKVTMTSKYEDITLGRAEKHGFKGLVTLHAMIAASSNPKMVGTDVVLEGVNDKEMEKAKDFFLVFSGETEIEGTSVGSVLRKKPGPARIYVKGVRVAEEEKFLFSYNITVLTAAMGKALNRERTNVGRTAYTDRVKSILLSCKESEVAKALVEDLQNYEEGTTHDEMTWIDVQVHAAKVLNAKEKVVFLTSEEQRTATDMVDEAEAAGYRIVTVPQTLRDKIHGLTDISGRPMEDLSHFYVDYNQSFQFQYIDPDDLTPEEKAVYAKTDAIMQVIGGRPKEVVEVKISQTMKKDAETFQEVNGLWEALYGRITIKRSQLRNLSSYSGTLLHEVAHCLSGEADVSRDFEEELTRFLGLAASKAMSK